jgi:hypothetical protein
MDILIWKGRTMTTYRRSPLARTSMIHKTWTLTWSYNPITHRSVLSNHSWWWWLQHFKSEIIWGWRMVLNFENQCWFSRLWSTRSRNVPFPSIVRLLIPILIGWIISLRVYLVAIFLLWSNEIQASCREKCKTLESTTIMIWCE